MADLGAPNLCDLQRSGFFFKTATGQGDHSVGLGVLRIYYKTGGGRFCMEIPVDNARP